MKYCFLLTLMLAHTIYVKAQSFPADRSTNPPNKNDDQKEDKIPLRKPLTGGNTLLWADRLGGTNFDNAYQMAIDSFGNVYTAGTFKGTSDFNPGPGTANLTSVGDYDVFISKLNAAGDYVWAKRVGGAMEDFTESISIDPMGNIYIAGNFKGTSDFDPGAGTTNLTAAGDLDCFISKYDASGSFIWARRLGGIDAEAIRSIALDKFGNILTGGFFNGTADFDPGAAIFNLTSSGDNDIFISKLDPSGNFIWARKIGGSGDDAAISISTDNTNQVLTTGRFTGTVDFNPGAGTSNLTSAGLKDIFISKLDASGNYVWAVKFGGASEDLGLDITTDATGHIYTTGTFNGTADFDPGTGTANLTSTGGEDAFISKLDPSGNFVWAKRVGGNDNDKLHSIITDASGDVFASGYFIGSSDFNPAPENVILTSAGGVDAFIIKLNNNGEFIWVNQFGGILDDLEQDMTLDPSGIIYTTGSFNGTADFDPGNTIFNLTSAGNTDIYIVALSQCIPTTSLISPTACNSYISPDGSKTWIASGTYHDTIPNAAGCDSVITVNLTIVQGSSSSISAAGCDSFLSPSGAYTWSVSGVYHDTIPNAAGCDSVITINLTLGYSSASTMAPSACDSYTSPSGAQTLTASGTYEDIIPNAAGCDSVITINLTIRSSTASTMNASACDRYTSPSGTQTWNTSGAYEDVLVNAAGCDSVITINLTITNSTVSSITASACDSYTSPSGTYTWTASGTYQDTILNANDCDSVITIQLTIQTIDTQVTQSESTLTAQINGGSYQWIDCNNGNQSIPGETAQQFVATSNGSYAVIISANGCTGTSSCFLVTTVGTEDISGPDGVNIYPNPVTSMLMVELDETLQQGKMSIIDVHGRERYSKIFLGEHSVRIDLQWPTGIYFMVVSTPDKRVIRKFVKE